MWIYLFIFGSYYQEIGEKNIINLRKPTLVTFCPNSSLRDKKKKKCDNICILKKM